MALLRVIRVDWKEPILCAGDSEEGAWANLSWALKEYLGETSEKKKGMHPNQRIAMGSQGMEDTARTNRHRSLAGPDKRSLWPGHDAHLENPEH